MYSRCWLSGCLDELLDTVDHEATQTSSGADHRSGPAWLRSRMLRDLAELDDCCRGLSATCSSSSCREGKIQTSCEQVACRARRRPTIERQEARNTRAPDPRLHRFGSAAPMTVRRSTKLGQQSEARRLARVSDGGGRSRSAASASPTRRSAFAASPASSVAPGPPPTRTRMSPVTKMTASLVDTAGTPRSDPSCREPWVRSEAHGSMLSAIFAAHVR